MSKKNKVINTYQEIIWKYLIILIADVFKIECDYCWWWRGVLLGSTLTSIIFFCVMLVVK